MSFNAKESINSIKLMDKLSNKNSFPDTAMGHAFKNSK